MTVPNTLPGALAADNAALRAALARFLAALDRSLPLAAAFGANGLTDEDIAQARALVDGRTP